MNDSRFCPGLMLRIEHVTLLTQIARPESFVNYTGYLLKKLVISAASTASHLGGCTKA